MEFVIEEAAEEESTLSNSEKALIARKRKQYKSNQKLKQQIKDLAKVQVLLRMEKHCTIFQKERESIDRSMKINSKAIRERLLAYAFLRGRRWQDTEETHRSDLPSLKNILYMIGKFWVGSDLDELTEELREWVPPIENIEP